MTPQDIESLFTKSDGSFLFARWGRPIVPIVFGVEDETLALVKGTFEAVVAMAGHKMAETDPELGANVMMFFFREWDELTMVPDLDRLIEGLTPLVDRLKHANANQYRVFRFDETGAIKACFVFLRMDDPLSRVPADALVMSQVVQSVVLWSDTAFKTQSPLAMANGQAVLRPDVAAIIRAGYDPVLPAVSQETSHALRLFARAQLAAD